ncbi:MAG TPA: phosphate ABC transporter substrate-binding protein PstS [Tepidisphaeraceae bacterium]|jgi:phosphate transport system substrate-binding protein
MLSLIKRVILSLAYMGSSKSVKAAVALVALGGGAAMADVRLQGAGATFPNPLYQKWVTEYQAQHPGVRIDYQSIGSGGGIKAITDKTVDFAGSDAPLTTKQMEALGGKAVHIPATAGAVVLAYNLPDFKGDLKLTGEVVADIFAGKIKQWNDSKIAALNSGATLPDRGITPCWRTDGSGTSYVFTNYLVTQSPSFKETVGMGNQVKWPAGTGGKGNDGVAAAVSGTPGSIGYVELNYATANKIPFALMQNKAGKFIKATPETVSAAGAGAAGEMTASKLAVAIWNQPGEEAYPIAAFTYLIVYSDLGNIKDAEKANALAGFLTWAVSPEGGQKLAPALDYAPLAPAVAEKALAAVKGLSYNGQAIK